MKTKLMLILMLATALLVVGCNSDDGDDVIVNADLTPQAPQGVTSVTGDGAVTIQWLGLWEDDINEYVVGWNDQLLGEYEEVGRVSADPRPQDNVYQFIDTDVDNGTTYFYAVWAVDNAGNVSEPSFEAVFDTPRPEGTVGLYSLFVDPTQSGFDLSSATRTAWDAGGVDVYIDDIFVGDGVDSVRVMFINAATLLTNIQDMGYTSSFDEIGWAPDGGWNSALGYFELIEGHTYLIWTEDYHYAKMRVTSISPSTGWANFQWAYQTADTTNEFGNRELSPGLPPGTPRDNAKPDDYQSVGVLK